MAASPTENATNISLACPRSNYWIILRGPCWYPRVLLEGYSDDIIVEFPISCGQQRWAPEPRDARKARQAGRRRKTKSPSMILVVHQLRAPVDVSCLIGHRYKPRSLFHARFWRRQPQIPRTLAMTTTILTSLTSPAVHADSACLAQVVNDASSSPKLQTDFGMPNTTS